MPPAPAARARTCSIASRGTQKLGSQAAQASLSATAAASVCGGSTSWKTATLSSGHASPIAARRSHNELRRHALSARGGRGEREGTRRRVICCTAWIQQLVP
jgi:hypothetical protein